jgi:hypothetical protein
MFSCLRKASFPAAKALDRAPETSPLTISAPPFWLTTHCHLFGPRGTIFTSNLGLLVFANVSSFGPTVICSCRGSVGQKIK